MRGDKARPGLAMGARVAVFLGVVVVLVWFTNIEPGRRFIATPVTRISVLLSQGVIHLCGGEARAEETMLLGPTTMLDVKDGCNGIIAMILFTGAVLAHEATLRAKTFALAVGNALIFCVNLVRIVTLYAVAVVAPARLEFFHVYFWQTLIIIFVAILWYAWAERTQSSAMRRAAATAAAPEGSGNPL